MGPQRLKASIIVELSVATSIPSFPVASSRFSWPLFRNPLGHKMFANPRAGVYNDANHFTCARGSRARNERRMPYTLNGFGTKYYGRRDQAADGSYVTTLWITALYVPLLPLGSYRVKPVGQGTNYVIHRSQNYQVLRIPMCWEQVWRVYMIGAPILLLGGGFIWTGVKKDRAKNDLRAQIKAAGAEIRAAQTKADTLEGKCFDLLKASNQDKEGLRSNLHEQCAPVPAAIDLYTAKVDTMQNLIRQGLAGGALEENEKSYLNTYQSIWNIRRHQAEESKQVMVCLTNVTHECYSSVATAMDAISKEDKQACTLLAAVDQKCE